MKIASNQTVAQLRSRPQGIAVGGCIPPPKFPFPTRLPVKATSNDPSLKVAVSGNIVKLNGVASNNGIVASTLTLKFGGRQISVPLSTGMKPAAVMKAVEQALPKGYSLLPVRTADGSVAFQIARSRPTFEPPFIR